MRTRTKIGVCVGLLVLAVGVVMAFRSPTKPAVEIEIKFVRYTKDGDAVLAFTNLGRTTMRVVSSAHFRELNQDPEAAPGLTIHYTLAPALGTQLVARRTLFLNPGATLSIFCYPVTSRLRHELEVLFSKVGLNIGSTNFVATVTLPPRPISASPSPPP